MRIHLAWLAGWLDLGMKSGRSSPKSYESLLKSERWSSGASSILVSSYFVKSISFLSFWLSDKSEDEETTERGDSTIWSDKFPCSSISSFSLEITLDESSFSVFFFIFKVFLFTFLTNFFFFFLLFSNYDNELILWMSIYSSSWSYFVSISRSCSDSPDSYWVSDCIMSSSPSSSSSASAAFFFSLRFSAFAYSLSLIPPSSFSSVFYIIF